MTFQGSFYYQGLQVSRAWVVVHRSRQTWEFDTTLWPTNHFLTSSNVALHFKRKEINRPNLYNLWTQSKSWLDRLLKMGIPVRLGDILLSKTKFYYWPIYGVDKSGLPLTTLQSMLNAKLSKQRFWQCYEIGLIKTIQTMPHNLYVSVKSASLYWGLG